MIEIINFLAAPFVLALFLVGIHAYLGLHVLRREVIFVDISLAQVAALGAAISLFWVHDRDDKFLGFIFSLILCLLVSIAFAWLRKNEKKVSQEALIGITYAFSSGALILVADQVPHGSEHLKEALVGNILFVTWPQVFQTAIVYMLIGLIHWFYRQSFWKASISSEGHFFWDLLFYFLFGIVITFSTQHAGVLVVFAILIAPAALATRFVQLSEANLGRCLLLAWTLGIVGTGIAFFLSYRFDWPSGASLVCTHTGLFLLSLLFKSKYH